VIPFWTLYRLAIYEYQAPEGHDAYPCKHPFSSYRFVNQLHTFPRHQQIGFRPPIAKLFET